MRGEQGVGLSPSRPLSPSSLLGVSRAKFSYFPLLPIFYIFFPPLPSLTSPSYQNLVFCSWLVVLRINVDLAIFQPYLDLEAGDYQSLKIQVARPGIEPRSSCSASQELNHSATAAPLYFVLSSHPLPLGIV